MITTVGWVIAQSINITHTYEGIQKNCTIASALKGSEPSKSQTIDKRQFVTFVELIAGIST